jgi:hypothetical protein
MSTNTRTSFAHNRYTLKIDQLADVRNHHSRLLRAERIIGQKESVEWRLLVKLGNS